MKVVVPFNLEHIVWLNLQSNHFNFVRDYVKSRSMILMRMMNKCGIFLLFSEFMDR